MSKPVQTSPNPFFWRKKSAETSRFSAPAGVPSQRVEAEEVRLSGEFLPVDELCHIASQQWIVRKITILRSDLIFLCFLRVANRLC